MSTIIPRAIYLAPLFLAPLFSTASLAQSANRAVSQGETRPLDDRPDDRAVEIEVTGSRIPRVQAEGAEPLMTLESDYLRDRALTNLADALNEQSYVRGSVTPAGSQPSFGQGVNFINLFRLGSNRTLVLLDGRRVVSSNVPSVLGNTNAGSQVDLNAIPAIMINRVETVAIGGAPAYGSDALAGTVNVLLRRHLTHLETRATYGLTGEGDAIRWNAAAAGGFDFAGGRGNLTGALSVDHQSGLLANARDFYRANIGPATNPCTVILAGGCSAGNLAAALGPAGRSAATDGRLNPAIGFNNTASDGFPATIFIRDLRLPAVTSGGVISSGTGAYGWRFAPGGNLVPYSTGTTFGAAIPGPLAAAALASGGDGLALNDYAQITSRLRRINGLLAFDFAASDRLRFFADALFYEGTADELVQQPTFNATLFGGSSGALTFRTDNPFVSAQARQQLSALGYGSTFQLSRANNDLADLTGWSRSRLYRGVAGVEGSVSLGRRDFRYAVSLTYGRNDFTDFGETIDQQKFVNAITVTTQGGQIVCSATATVTGFPAGQSPKADPACAPLNLFGEGAPSAAALAYVLRDTRSESRMEQFVVNANIGGSPVSVFGNPASFNLGFEHRGEKARFTPDLFLQQGLGRSAAVVPTSGSYALNELFGEVLVPLITPSNHSVIARLELFGRVRHVENSINGGFTAWSAGGSLAPVEDIELRGNYTRSFRAPAVTELFTPRSVVATSVPDLCSPANIAGGPVPEVRLANCTALLARYPSATPLIAAIATVPGYSGGNPILENETASSFTFGAALRPRFTPGLTLSADYLDITIQRPISSLSASQIAQGCFDNPDFNAGDPANGNIFCSLIRRGADGQVISDAANPGITTGYVNGKLISMAAIQFTLDYSTRLDAVGLPGALSLTVQAFNLRHRMVDVTGIAPLRSDGLLTDPHWQAQFMLRYAGTNWGMMHRLSYTGTQIAAVTNRGESPNDTREFDRFAPFATVDSSLFVEPRRGMRLTFSVTNLFNRVGQTYYGAIVPVTINDALGRRFALSAEQVW